MNNLKNMKEKNHYLIIFAFIFMFINISCGDKDKFSKTSKIIFAPQFINADESSVAVNTFLIYGRLNEGQDYYFIKSITNNSSRLDIDVRSGSWTFYAISWSAENSAETSLGNMGGTVRCSSRKDLTITDGQLNVSISLDLSRSNCSDSSYAPNGYFSVGTSNSTNYFYPLRVVTCYSLQQSQVTADTLCDNSNGIISDLGKGSIRSFEIVFPVTKDITTKSLFTSTIDRWKESYSNIGGYQHLLESNFKSKCFTISSDLSTSFIDTNLKIPVGSVGTLDSPFSPMIFAYSDSTCSSSSYKVYKISDGLSESTNSSNLITTRVSSSRATVFISDNATAATVRSSCKEILSAEPSAVSGVYKIDPDGTNTGVAAFNVYCDMANGGWMRIVNDHTTTVADLASFGSISAIQSNFYTNTTYGIGWGLLASETCIDLTSVASFTNVKLKISALSDYVTYGGNGALGGYGYLRISANPTTNDDEFLYFQDAWGQTQWGSNQLFIKETQTTVAGVVGKFVFVHVTKYPVEAAYSGTHLKICMGGDPDVSGSLNYNKRYISDLWIK
ncbi:MAG: hypothetical protein HQK49_21375 [Oligoflexia bacterium]|nr:hypothetical protein [Oligoflexia bacterium]